MSEPKRDALDFAMEIEAKIGNHTWSTANLAEALSDWAMPPAPPTMPEGDDAINQSVEDVIAWLDGHDITTRPRDALILRDEVLRLRARLASLDAAKDGREMR